MIDDIMMHGTDRTVYNIIYMHSIIYARINTMPVLNIPVVIYETYVRFVSAISFTLVGLVGRIGPGPGVNDS